MGDESLPGLWGGGGICVGGDGQKEYCKDILTKAYSLILTSDRLIANGGFCRITCKLFRENPTRAEMRSMNESCLPVFKYYKPQRKSKVLVHGFGDSAENSLMFPILRDGKCLSQISILVIFNPLTGSFVRTPHYSRTGVLTSQPFSTQYPLQKN